MPVDPKISLWAQNMLTKLRASQNKVGVLAVLVMVLVGAWVRLLTGGNGPNAAKASLVSVPAGMASILDSLPRHEAGSGISVQEWARAKIVPIHRNLFTVPLDYYPRDGSSLPGSAPSEDGFWGQMAKSLSATADQEQQRRILTENARTRAAGLQLQSTMMGFVPSAIVDGQVVRVGSDIEGFRVLEIEARQVVLESDDIAFAITMR